MDFDLSPAHERWSASVAAFAEREVGPHAGAWDAAGRFPPTLLPRLASLGLLGILVPETWGGAGLDTLAYALAVEACARHDGALALALASHNGLGVGHLLAVGTDPQKGRYLPRAARGEALAAWALTEPGGGSDAAALRTTAVRDGSAWVLEGHKAFITHGAAGGLTIVLAVTNREVPPHLGMTAFIVEPGTPGYTAGPPLEKLGCRACETVEVRLDGVRVPDEQRLGAVDRGLIDASRVLDLGRIGVAAMALGLGRGALQQGLAHAERRQAFGKVLAEHAVLAHRIAEWRTRLDAAELLVRRAAWLRDRGRPHACEASMAKLYASEAAGAVCDDMVQVHGGSGYTRALAIERLYRDVRVTRIVGGTSEVLRALIARRGRR